MKILLIDNGTKLLHRLQELIPGREVTMRWKNLSHSDTNKYDLIILSGSSTSSVLLNHQDFEQEVSLIHNTKKPIIGICFGCELIVYALGGSLRKLSKAHNGIKHITMTDQCLSDKEIISVYEHHKYIIDELPDVFEVLARSIDGPEAIKHKTRPIYGLQFHPENLVDDNDGRDLFNNILKTIM